MKRYLEESASAAGPDKRQNREANSAHSVFRSPGPIEILSDRSSGLSASAELLPHASMAGLSETSAANVDLSISLAQPSVQQAQIAHNSITARGFPNVKDRIEYARFLQSIFAGRPNEGLRTILEALSLVQEDAAKFARVAQAANARTPPVPAVELAADQCETSSRLAQRRRSSKEMRPPDHSTGRIQRRDSDSASVKSSTSGKYNKEMFKMLIYRLRDHLIESGRHEKGVLVDEALASLIPPTEQPDIFAQLGLSAEDFVRRAVATGAFKGKEDRAGRQWICVNESTESRESRQRHAKDKERRLRRAAKAGTEASPTTQHESAMEVVAESPESIDGAPLVSRSVGDCLRALHKAQVLLVTPTLIDVEKHLATDARYDLRSAAASLGRIPNVHLMDLLEEAVELQLARRHGVVGWRLTLQGQEWIDPPPPEAKEVSPPERRMSVSSATTPELSLPPMHQTGIEGPDYNRGAPPSEEQWDVRPLIPILFLLAWQSDGFIDSVVLQKEFEALPLYKEQYKKAGVSDFRAYTERAVDEGLLDMRRTRHEVLYNLTERGERMRD